MHLLWITAGAVAIFLLLMRYASPLKCDHPYVYISSNQTALQALLKHGCKINLIQRFGLKEKVLSKGWYNLNPCARSYRCYETIETLQSAPSHLMEVVIYGGENKRELLSRLARDTRLSYQTLLFHYNRLARFREGDLIAGRYSLERNADAFSVIEAIFAQSHEKLIALLPKNFDPNDTQSLNKMLTVASIIQKETYHPHEMPLIASVIYNRLGRGMKLQMDATLNYGKYSRIPVTADRIRNDKSLYNTYKHKGLPPSPLSAVSPIALLSAFHPVASSYLFFVLNSDGTHRFSTTYQKHLEAIEQIKIQKQRKNLTASQPPNPTKRIEPSRKTQTP